jgi:hypothetical protein
VLINEFAGPEPQPGEFWLATIAKSHDYDLVARLEKRLDAERTSAPRPLGSLVQIQPAGVCV